MKALFFSFVLLSISVLGFTQNTGIDFGKISVASFNVQSELIDPETPAIVLYEYADIYFDTEDTYQLMYEYHTIIKILKPEGLSEADVSIPIYKNEKAKEKINWLRAASYTLADGQIREQSISKKDIFIEDPYKYTDEHKFSIPGASVGSIIEYRYSMQTPFILNLKTWYFQNHLPKIKSGFTAKIPGNYLYNIALRGYLKLTTEETKIENDCVRIADYGLSGKTGANCLVIHYEIETVPAFKEEAYMTSKENFLSAIRFELTQINRFNGSVDKLSKSWKDVESELITDKNFGIQLKKGTDFFKKNVKLKAVENDSLEAAKFIYDKIATHFTWNNTYGYTCEFGIEKAYQKSAGNIGDINLALVAALRANNFKADPMLLSTRSSGIVTELYPVLSEFNYVVAKLQLGGKFFLIDASSKLPFGILPVKCLNGKGRVIPDKNSSYWQEIKTSTKFKTLKSIQFSLDENQFIHANGNFKYEGYKALEERSKRNKQTSLKDYQLQLFKNFEHTEVLTFEEKDTNQDDLPYSYNFKLKILPATENSDIIYFDLFMLSEKWINPFKLQERNYPVDFGAPMEETMVISLEWPETFILESAPKRVGKSLPNNGGIFLYDSNIINNKLNITFRFLINKTTFSSEEYFYLKEFYNTVLDLRNTPIVLKRKQ
ncbi:MAG: DUF3857 domain-containing protein [Cyclobacteriaceae bacterium]|jgi:hypothetical protein|nr:DUF3857 domain-containing protein [Cyclobacteriaceae bacterium]